MKINNLIRNIFYFFLVISFLIAFSSYIDNVLGEKIVKGRIDSVQSNGWLDLFLVLTLCLYISIKAKDCSTDKPNERFIFVVLIVTIYYIYERFFNDFFSFTQFKISEIPPNLLSVKYCDILFIIITVELVAYLKYLNPKYDKVKDNNLLEDSPIESLEEDKFDGLFIIPANKIIKIIHENSFKSSFTIGLNGGWGDGKTSIFNLVKNKFQNEEHIIIDFNPWIGFDRKVLIKDFFNSLSEEMGVSLSQNISDYVDEILNNGDDLTVPRIIKSITRKNKSLYTIFEEINEKIGFLDKKIIVFIDDVDRLDKEEVLEILKLIRKTANFQRFFFIVAYDRNYVNNSIEGQIGESSIKYLDKIINVEINLPYFEKSILKNYFVEELRKRLPDNLHYKVDEFLKRYESDDFLESLGLYETQSDLFEVWLNNFREIKKVINSILINYNQIYKDVDLFDVIHLEILKLKHPYIYQIIYTKKDEILQSSTSENFYYLSYKDRRIPNSVNLGNGQRSLGNNNNDEKPVFDTILDKYIERTNLGSIEGDKITQLIDVLFPRIKDGRLNIDFSPDENFLGVRYTTKFERYFSHSIFNHHLSEDDFIKLLNLNDKVEIISIIKKWVDEGKAKDISMRINKYFEFRNEKDYKNTLFSSLFLLNNREQIKGNLIDYRSVISKMFNQDFTSIFESLNNAKDFFKDFFKIENIALPYMVESQILHDLKKRNSRRNDNDDSKFPLNDEEIEKIIESYVLNFINEEVPFDGIFWTLYYYALKKRINKQVIDDSIKERLKASLSSLNRKESFLGSLITKDLYFFKLRIDGIISIFDTYDEFEKFFFSEDVSTYIEEFRQFYETAKSNDWREIEFEFNLITEPQ
ncbi:KAP family P-loop NTPase fold protein [Elizabethkingia anophelis]|uniref:KAP family P-loop NTPase fold protein n=1 Tax=Elizabethkingia anophelis TaxID=1117645 RepID=UPI00083FDCEB|nr:P-loop NTPase fold protein [Elizabethkingia anophelis]OCW74130.1 hypothetical protein A4G24_03175 [Elizabethkingia anophelis]